MAGRLPVVLVVAIVALNSLGIGLVIPVMPQLLQQMGHTDLANAAAIGGLLSLAFAGMQVLFSPLLGSLSDWFGRRPVLILSLVVTSIDYAILASAPVLWLFFVARIISGMSSATFAVANATLADLSPPEKRAAYFGFTGGAFGLGFVLGPVMGGLLGEFGPRAPFWTAAALCMFAAILCATLLPETLQTGARRPVSWRGAVPFAALAKLRRGSAVLPLVGVNFLDSLAGMVYPAVWAYFALAQFGWSTSTVGLSLAVYGLCFAAIQAGLVRLFVARLGETSTAIFGLSAGVFGFIILTSLNSGVLAFLLTPLFAVRAVSNTALNGLMSKRTAEDAQGELQGILTGVTGVATLVAIPLLTQVFALANAAHLANPWRGAPFAVAAFFSGGALLLLIVTLRSQEKNQLQKGSRHASTS